MTRLVQIGVVPFAATAVIGDASGTRVRLRELDACLCELEEAHERGEVTVSTRLSNTLKPFLSTLPPETSITNALDLVFREQEKYLEPGLIRSMTAPPLDCLEARRLTKRIKKAGRLVCMLLAEAHLRRAWSALGYESWASYVSGEFGLSRSRSYELLDQANVIQAIQSVTEMSGIPDISVDAARQIKPHLGELINRIRGAILPSMSRQQVIAVVDRAVQLARGDSCRHQRVGPTLGRSARGNVFADRGLAEPATLRELVDRLASMPPASVLVSHLSDDEVEGMTGIERAVVWLIELAEQLRGRRHVNAL